ncbi:type IV secretion system DNA-binding domain-containing protein [Dorea acetigenes]|uniref:Type IV secretion system DNA-binding domain-containing protein n=1 Tax=Dorea acetigenes TaxID=2981787 RepID=A0ABT2RPQ6_9FIRM|nr:type IV secretion system DNA-binding domain-containing protein [Dorea acetigenes]MCU6687401.1 type IV secretion system DNA-binding domain-containing protein [Dorea acetigenes]SCJ39973.1 Type IV secretory pathway%2C VirD4 components [uncultured Clostridium sp.]
MARSELTDITWKEVIWHRPFKLEQVIDMLNHLAALKNRGAIIWETRASNGKIIHLIGTQTRFWNRVAETIKVHGDIEFYSFEKEHRAVITTARKLKISHSNLSLRTDITESTIRAGLAALAATAPNEEAVLQIILGKAFSPNVLPKNISDPSMTWLDAALGHATQASAETRKSMKEKAEQYNFESVIRIGVTNKAASSRIGNIACAFRVLESVGVRITEEKEKAENLNLAHIPWQFPLKLSIKELASFLLLPFGIDELPGTLGLHPRMVHPPEWYANPRHMSQDRTFAESLNPSNAQKLSISPEAALEHTIILGPTGSGKSTAMLNLILADINAGRSVLVLDPKADLVTNILERIPMDRADDVVVINPADDQPVGFNPLSLPGDSTLIADAILAVFKEIFSDNWGIRTQDVLSAALMTLCATKDVTLLWLPALLMDENFREKITKDIKDKIALKPFWDTFSNLRPAEREQWVAPVLNKVRQFLFRPGLRGILGQSNPKFQLTDLFYQRKIVLVPLNKGVIGAESAKLLGSLIVGLSWTLALSRANIPPEKRHLVSLYIDELQDYLSLPTDLSDALAQARGLGVGITMAHQYRAQLPREIQAGVDANARNKIVFGLNASDARDIAAMAPDLTMLDFMSLPRYHVYTNFMYYGRPTGWVQGKTCPPTHMLHTAADISARSQIRYGRPRDEVESDFIKLMESNEESPNGETDESIIGRRRII